MKRVALLQPTYLPYPGLFQIMSCVDEFYFMTDVQFSTRSWQQRNKIRTPRNRLGEVPQKLKHPLLVGAGDKMFDEGVLEALSPYKLDPFYVKKKPYLLVRNLYENRYFIVKGHKEEVYLEESGDVFKVYSKGWKWLKVPTVHASRGTAERILWNVEVDNSVAWWHNHLTNISGFYAKSPWFEEYWPHLEHIYSREWDRLAMLNIELIKWLREQFSIKTDLAVEGEVPYDRDTGHTDEGKTQRLINFCDAVGADCYVEPGGGSAFIKEEMFDQAGIELRWAHYDPFQYVQLWDGFVPYMSALDVLFCLGPRAKNKMAVMWYDEEYVEDLREPIDMMPPSLGTPPMKPGKVIRGDKSG